MNKEIFIKELKKMNITLTAEQLNQFEKYYEILVIENEKYNLTAITKKEDVYLKHYYDSLTLTKIIDLKEIQIKINKIKEIQYVNEVQSQIAVSIYDEKEAESIYSETVYNLKSLNVKLNKKIPLFLK